MLYQIARPLMGGVAVACALALPAFAQTTAQTGQWKAREAFPQLSPPQAASSAEVEQNSTLTQSQPGKVRTAAAASGQRIAQRTETSEPKAAEPHVQPAAHTGAAPRARHFTPGNYGARAGRSPHFSRRIQYQNNVPGPPAEEVLPMPADEEVMPESIVDGAFEGHGIPFEPGYGHGDCGGCGDCSSCGFGGCGPCPPYGICLDPLGLFKSPCDWCWLDDLTVSTGVQGFKGPLDVGQQGNFGFHTGVNWGGPLWNKYGFGYQVGYNFIASNFEGDDVGLPGDDRTQHFVTAGIFRRIRECGIQYGAVADWLSEDYYEDYDAVQVRAEMSYVGRAGREIGFMGAFHTEEDDLPLTSAAARNLIGDTMLNMTTFEQYQVFYRQKFQTGAEGRLNVGLTDEGEVLFGGNLLAPISHSLSVQGNFVYLAPDETEGLDSADDEAWAVSMSLVWYPRPTATKSVWNQYRPLFSVADNASFILKRD